MPRWRPALPRGYLQEPLHDLRPGLHLRTQCWLDTTRVSERTLDRSGVRRALGRSSLLLGVLLGGPGPLHAQQDRVAFRHLTIADGLSQNAVQAIVQDSRGFMWFGTKDGLNRYDGYQFVVFRHDPFDSTSIADSDITALFEDKTGRLWVGTRGGGLSRFDRARERFDRFPSGPRRPITGIAEDGNGRSGRGWCADGRNLARAACVTVAALR